MRCEWKQTDWKFPIAKCQPTEHTKSNVKRNEILLSITFFVAQINHLTYAREVKSEICKVYQSDAKNMLKLLMRKKNPIWYQRLFVIEFFNQKFSKIQLRRTKYRSDDYDLYYVINSMSLRHFITLELNNEHIENIIQDDI